MILYILLSLMIDTLSLERGKEINLEKEIIFQPKLIENQIFIFLEEKVLKLNCKNFSIENFFEGNTYKISEKGIIFEKNGKNLYLPFSSKEKNDGEKTHNFSGLKAKKVFEDNDFFYVQTDDNSLYCVGKSNSKKRWKIKSPSEIMALISDKKRIYILCGSNILLTLKRKTGDILWWKSLKERCFPKIGFFGENIVLSTREGVQFLSKNNGSLITKTDVSLSFAPIIAEDHLFLFTKDKILIYKAKK